MQGILMLLLTVFPFVFGFTCLAVKNEKAIKWLVSANAVVLICSSLALVFCGQNFLISSEALPFSIGKLMGFLDFLLLGLIGWFGFKHKHWAVVLLCAAQAAILIYADLFVFGTSATSIPLVRVDSFAVLMVLIVSVVGSLITVFAVPYMRKHNAHHKTFSDFHKSSFFAVMLMFLGAMNALVTSNNILYLYLFFEFTTLCSFLLIGYDKTYIATKNALRALWMNSLAGLAMVCAVVLFYVKLHTFDIQRIVDYSFGNHIILLPITLLLIAAFVKSAQLPFQSWLLGAMVAPTPVSALLHSSTMVKIGVYLALRFSPAYMDTFVADSVVLFGAFVFLTTAALALAQSNAKKILAYSTISNLGLIFACAGIGTAEAVAAGIFLIVFHAVSKALLFLCTGAVEQKIKSRDIEDMQGIYKIMPVVTSFMLIGMVSIVLPPFGMLVGKWMAIEAAASINIPALIVLLVGSSVTFLYWTRWAGMLMNSYNPSGLGIGDLHFLSVFPLAALALLVVIVTLFSPTLFNVFVIPLTSDVGLSPFTATGLGLFGYKGSFLIAPIAVVVFISLSAAVYYRYKMPFKSAAPYMCGINGDKDDEFVGPGVKSVPYKVFNYYFLGFGKGEMANRVFNVLSILLLCFMLGGAIQSNNGMGIW